MKTLALILCALATLSACQLHQPLKTIDYLDIERFMGDWYVMAAIPTPLEKGAHNAVESYTLNSDGSISTIFTFFKGNFNGDKKHYSLTGFVKDTQSNARWSIQFIWPIKADYRVVHLSDNYDTAIVGRQARDYVWVMKRTPTLSDQQFADLSVRIAKMGYNISQLRRIPQRWGKLNAGDS